MPQPFPTDSQVTRSRVLMPIAALLAAVALCLGIAACGGDDDEQAVEPAQTERQAEDSAESEADGTESAPESAGDRVPDPPDAGINERPGVSGRDQGGSSMNPETEAPSESQRDAIAGAVTRYIEALTMSRGRQLCHSTFVAGALRGVQLPVRRDSCPETIRASIGATMKPGGPRWRGATLNGMKAVIVTDSGDARVTAGVANRLAGSNRSWVEDDVVYLREVELGGDDGDRPADAGRGSADDDRWRVVKPSGTFYRAVGYADIPISAFVPPS